VTPHADVASGRYQQAEFAADLWQVHLGEGSDESKKPQEFFRRTYLTESLKRLLVGGVQRLSGQGGDPVVQLQTNFGGGKTHSMLAIYHLFSGANPGELAGVDAVLAEAGVKSLPRAKCVVLVGNKISPGNPVTKPDGTVVRTLWGELAWQLGGKKAFARQSVGSDAHRLSPPRGTGLVPSPVRPKRAIWLSACRAVSHPGPGRLSKIHRTALVPQARSPKNEYVFRIRNRIRIRGHLRTSVCRCGQMFAGQGVLTPAPGASPGASPRSQIPHTACRLSRKIPTG